METFTLRVPWWPTLRLFSRNPLLRAVDRVEAVFVLAAVVVSLLGALFAAAAVSTAVHDARSHLYAQQAQTRHAVSATGTDADAAAAQPAPPHEVIIVPAQRPISGTAPRGAIKPAPTIHTLAIGSVSGSMTTVSRLRSPRRSRMPPMRPSRPPS